MRGLHPGLSLPAALFLLASCGDKDDDTASVGPPVPSEGTWTVTDFSASVDSCGWEDGGNADEADTSFDLVLTEAGLDLIIAGGQTVRWSCSLDAGVFSCEDDVESLNVAGDIVTYTQSFAGSFDSDSSGTASWGFDLSCEEDSCDRAEEAMGMPVPCQVSAQATMGLEEAS